MSLLRKVSGEDPEVGGRSRGQNVGLLSSGWDGVCSEENVRAGTLIIWQEILKKLLFFLFHNVEMSKIIQYQDLRWTFPAKSRVYFLFLTSSWHMDILSWSKTTWRWCSTVCPTTSSSSSWWRKTTSREGFQNVNDWITEKSAIIKNTLATVELFGLVSPLYWDLYPERRRVRVWGLSAGHLLPGQAGGRHLLL